ncbi:hypothetical protein TRFO_28787 [Tritrichomonas foetus]|uniref:Initiator binding domain-containing protein n=1 Tax=Tritrichomonas foetus TaxID=1144522 RepID=A0A1J4K312_9EUKA|nr:hypothetical protein TRFO_28787 [Tritrichomonas foetus]|eukprot:OHT03885.1 hypothetical protein TRFO_28787 [Tritrichomonas foetus]
MLDNSNSSSRIVPNLNSNQNNIQGYQNNQTDIEIQDSNYIDQTEETNNGRPLYWDLLSKSDQSAYLTLQNAFNSSAMKRNRGHRLETFGDILDTIRDFSEHKDVDDWRRFLVCGVCWMDNAIAINTRQLRLLISRCKSSINGSLQKLGYITNPSHSKSWNALFAQIPLLKDNFAEIRQWTIRVKPRISIPNHSIMPNNFQNTIHNMNITNFQKLNHFHGIHINNDIHFTRNNENQSVIHLQAFANSQKLIQNNFSSKQITLVPSVNQNYNTLQGRQPFVNQIPSSASKLSSRSQHVENISGLKGDFHDKKHQISEYSSSPDLSVVEALSDPPSSAVETMRGVEIASSKSLGAIPSIENLCKHLPIEPLPL